MKKMKILSVIDMQGDFVNGSLANPAAQAIVDAIAKFVEEFDGAVIGTRDTHLDENSTDYASLIKYSRNLYSSMMESKLPAHCIAGTKGVEIVEPIMKAITAKPDYYIIDKMTFGYTGWKDLILRVLGLHLASDDAFTVSALGDKFIESITLVGTCTDICVISNALILRALFPNVKIIVIGSLCAGCSKELHENALNVMRSCMIEVQ